MITPRYPRPDTPSWQPGAVFEILFVCTGNACRSAFAQLLARQLLVDRFGPDAARQFAVTSAGVRATPGQPLHPGMLAALQVWGVSADPAFAARRLDETMILRADLILAAEESHRSVVAWMSPDALPKVYGMRRFARLLRTVDRRCLPAAPVHRALRIMEWAPRLHAALPNVPPDEEAIPDPINGGPREHLRSADLLCDVVGAYIDVLAPTCPSPI